MANIRTEGVLIPATATLLRTIGTGASGDQIARGGNFGLCNHDLSNSRSVDIFLKPQAEAIDLLQHKCFTIPLEPGECRRLDLPIVNLQEGDEIQWRATAASQVAGTFSLNEINASSAYVNIPAQYAPNGTFDDIREVPSGFQAGSVLLCAHNLDTVERTVEFRGLESGASTANRYTIWMRKGSFKLQPGETDISSWAYNFLTGTGAFQVSADAVDKVVVFGGLTEFAII